MNIGNEAKAVLLSLAAILASGIIGCGSAEEGDKRALENVPLEKKLADLDAGHIVSDYNDAIPHFKYLLGELGSKFVEDPERIASLTLTAQKTLKQKGVYESLVDIMEGINQAAHRSKQKQKYADYVQVYAEVRRQKMSQREAIGALKLIMASERNK